MSLRLEVDLFIDQSCIPLRYYTDLYQKCCTAPTNSSIIFVVIFHMHFLERIAAGASARKMMARSLQN